MSNQEQKRILRIKDDPAAVKIIEHIRAYPPPEAMYDVRGIIAPTIEALAANNLVPVEWTEEEWPEKHNTGALLTALRNPRSLIDAEALLQQGIAWTPGRYVGLRSWDQLRSKSYAVECGCKIPYKNALGYKNVDVSNLDPEWLEETRGTGSSYGSGMIAHVWRCADQIFGGPPWVQMLYETGLGMWCWEDMFKQPAWALIAREGDLGLPWPRLAGI